MLEYIWTPIPSTKGPNTIERGLRHAFHGARRHYAEGEPAIAICGTKVTFTDHGDWLAPSCVVCWEQARALQQAHALRQARRS